MTSSPYTDAELIALAKAATPGPWLHRKINPTVKLFAIINSNGPHGDEVVAGYTGEQDAAFIAAFNPETALSLLARIAALEELLDRASEELRLINMKDCGAIYDIGLRSDLRRAAKVGGV